MRSILSRTSCFLINISKDNVDNVRNLCFSFSSIAIVRNKFKISYRHILKNMLTGFVRNGPMC
jgi:hypothetical protein